MLGLLLLNMVFCSSASTQTSSVSEGSIITDIYIKIENNQEFLIIEGVLKPDNLKRIEQKKDTANKRLKLILPDTIIDPEKITSSVINFEADKSIEKIQIIKEPEKTGSGLAYNTIFHMQARKNLKLITTRRDTSMLKILLEEVKPKVKEEPVQVQAKVTEEVPATKEIPAEEARFEPMTASASTAMADNETELARKNKQSINMSARLKAQKIIQKYRRPKLLRVAILNASGYSQQAYNLSVYLSKVKKKHIEKSLGIKLVVVNIADAKSDKYHQSTIYFRDNSLKSALFLAELIPGEQKLVPLKNQKEKTGVDIEIFLGKDYK